MGDMKGPDPVLTRMHSECLTGDAFGSLRCDCGAQLDAAMRQISQKGWGVILYLRQEGRGRFMRRFWLTIYRTWGLILLMPT